MNEYALIGVSIISGCFTLGAIALMQHNWYKKEQAKHTYYIKRAKLSKKLKTPPPAPPSASGGTDYLQVLQQLPPDLLHSLVDQLGGDQAPDEGGISETILDMVKQNPELVQNFLSNVRGKTNDQDKMVYEE